MLASERASEVFGYTCTELTKLSIGDLIPSGFDLSDDGQLQARSVTPEFHSVSCDHDVRGRHKDGREFPVEITLRSHTTAEGRFVVTAVRDITTQQRAQAEARRWSDAFDKAAFGISIVDAQSLNVVAINPAYAAMHGMTVAELRDYPVMDMVAPESHSTVRDAIMASDRLGQITYDLTRVRKDGTHFPAQISLTSVRDSSGAPLYRIATLIDTTERQKVEAERRHWSDAFERAAFGISIVDPATFTIVAANPAYDALHGFTIGEAASQRILDLITPDCHEAAIAASRVSDATGQAECQLTRLRKDGSRFQAHTTLTSVHDAAGRLLYRIATVMDITDRLKAEAAIHRWYEVFEKAAFGISITDAETNRLVEVNPAYASMHGMSVEELRNYPVIELYLPDDIPMALRHRELAGGMGYTTFEATRVRKDGSRFVAQISLARVQDTPGGPQVRIASLLDITERQKTQVHLQQMQRLEAVGRLTAGIAHDFNNILGAIINNQDLIIDSSVSDPSASHAHAEDTLKAAFSGADLVRRMLAFARQQPMHPHAVDLNDLIIGLKPLLQRALDESVDVRIDCSPDLPPVLADPGQLESALLNLAVNARDAMPGGGVLSISTNYETVRSDQYGIVTPLQPGTYATVSVADTGIGMDVETLSHAFEPFFTTKGVGEGTGLGLSMVLGSMEQLGGTAKISSKVGHGTTVRLYLPCATDTHSSGTSEVERKNDDMHKDARILVVEDNELIRDSVMAMLRSLGYEVVGVADGRAAIALLDTGQQFDLVFTDIVLPGRMSGVALAREIFNRSSSARVLLTSGFADPEQYQAEIDALGLSLLVRPYRKSTLAKYIRSALDSEVT